MKKLALIGAFTGGLLALSTPTAAQGGGGWMQGDMMGMRMPGRGMMMMGRLSPDDMSAFVDAHVAALKAGLQLSPEQEKLWPPVEEAMRGLARLHLAHMQAMRQGRGAPADDPIGLLRSMAERMSQGADAARALADAAQPLYATLDDAQKRRLRILVHGGPRGMMGSGMMGPRGPAMMRGGWFGSDDEDDMDER